MVDEEKNLGSVFGGILLIAGSCIGAGMLALPILAGLSGFYPSIVLFSIAWAFMTFTGLLLVEVNGWFYERVNIVSMAQKAFGNGGAIISWLLYLFLFYSLLIAYIAGSGTIMASFFQQVFSIKFASYIGSICFVIAFGIFVYFGTKSVDWFNRFLMLGLVSCYFGLVIFGVKNINPVLLKHVNLKYSLIPLSVLVTSFGFHNMIPSLTAYMKGDLFRMKITIIVGSFFVLIVYFLWNTLVLGVVPFSGPSGLLSSYQHGREAAQVLYPFLGKGWEMSFARGFAFFAIVTSFIAQSLSLMHFIADGFKIMPDKKHKLWLCLLTLIPPTCISCFYPEVFFQALQFAGGFCAVILFGLLPVFMAWVGRYKKKIETSYRAFGGKTLLIITGIFSLFVVVKEIITWFFL